MQSPNSLQKQFSMTNSEVEYSQRWEKVWKGGESGTELLQPGQAFDAKQSSPALLTLLNDGTVNPSGKRVFVPGCGRGYDLVTFIKAGAASAVGLELAPTAVAAANEFTQEALKNDDEKASRIQIIEGDFFGWMSEEGPFDIGFDYTFFCALMPSQRKEWASAWSKHLKPGGILIALIFPVDVDRDRVGPPWPVYPDLYRDALEGVGFSLKSLEKLPENMSHPGRGGSEYMSLWMKEEDKAVSNL